MHHNTTNRITDFGEARKVQMMETSMTMTSGVGSPFYVAPEIIMNEKHYTSAVDVFSFGIMAAQVMVGRLVYDAEEFTTEYGLCSKLFFFTTNPTYPIMVFVIVVQHFVLLSAGDFDQTSLGAQLR